MLEGGDCSPPPQELFSIFGRALEAIVQGLHYAGFEDIEDFANVVSLVGGSTRQDAECFGDGFASAEQFVRPNRLVKSLQFRSSPEW